MRVNTKIVFSVALLIALLVRCGGTPLPKNPIVELQKDAPKDQVYTVVLADMDLKGTQYKHKYKIFEVEGDNVNIRTTGLIDVSDDFFHLHENDLGMEVRSQEKNGKINNLITPPGFTHFINKEEYGQWERMYFPKPGVVEYTDSTFWVFKDKYKFVEKELGIEGLDVTMTEYQKFLDSYRYNRPFYGEKTAPDSTKYGTRSRHWVYFYPGFYSRRSYTRNFYKPTTSRSRTRGGGGFGK